MIRAWASADPHLHVCRSSRHIFHRVGVTTAGVGCILLQNAQDVGDFNGVVIGVPAIVVSNHGDGYVTDLGLAREFGFLKVRHANDVHVPGAVGGRFGLRREHGALPCEMHKFHRALTLTDVARQAGFGGRGKLRTNGIGEADVGHKSVTEEGGDPATSSVEELVWDEEIEGAVFFLKGADGAEREDPVDAERFHAVDVGAIVEFGG